MPEVFAAAQIPVDSAYVSVSLLSVGDIGLGSRLATIYINA